MTTPDCCASPPSVASKCPTCDTTGKAVPLVTLKALLTPAALATLDPEQAHRFCPNAGCDSVYFSPTRVYGQVDLKVAVYQKDEQATTPACYCFGHTRADLARAVREGHPEAIPRSIQAHIRAGRCGCEVNNPQGTCCLGNVNRALATLQETSQA